ncbi:MAG: capsule polysaccharide export protein KpsE/RkpR [Halocynthiibacter sp.]|jgi:capsular polysaccharide transport system permease protein
MLLKRSESQREADDEQGVQRSNVIAADSDLRAQAWREERAKIAQEEQARAQSVSNQNREAEARRLVSDRGTIGAAQSEFVARAKARKAQLLRQLAIFVFGPALLVLGYQSLIAVPLFEARAVVVIAKPGSSSGTDLGGLLGSLAAPSQMNEAFMADEYVRSQALMDDLEGALGLISRLSSDEMDPVRRLRDFPILRISKRDQFTRFVDSSINIQTGLMTLYVRAPTPDQAILISEAILARTAVQINDLSDALFEQRMAQARSSVDEARVGLSEAQKLLISRQISSGEVSPQARIEGVYANIQQMESEALALVSLIQQAEVGGQAGSYATQRLVERERLLRTRIEQERRLLVEAQEGAQSLNALLVENELAALQVRIAEETLSASLAALAQAGDAAALGRSTFQVIVPPRTSGQPSAPNPIISALVAFFGLLSMFVMIKIFLARP